LFDLYDSDADHKLTLNELAVLLHEIGTKITALPAVSASPHCSPICDHQSHFSQTAQVASQQGKYLGHKLHLLASKRDTLAANEFPADADEALTGPFNYRHLGSLAYVGNAAVFDFGGLSFTGGLVAMYAWRSIYWSEQVSMRTRALLMIDWIVRYVASLLRLAETQIERCCVRQRGMGQGSVEAIVDTAPALDHAFY
jgi:NADH dehydrogenase